MSLKKHGIAIIILSHICLGSRREKRNNDLKCSANDIEATHVIATGQWEARFEADGPGLKI